MVVFYLEAQRWSPSEIDYFAKLNARRMQTSLSTRAFGMAIIPSELLNRRWWLRHALQLMSQRANDYCN